MALAVNEVAMRRLSGLSGAALERAARQLVERMWERGLLPYRWGKGWVAGMTVSGKTLSFLSVSAGRTVGPARPTRFCPSRSFISVK